ncbi:MAG: hypothetical protein Q9Q40_03440 [Acidobacteriota bacterium]|nr:hypothetical protein [Acidobacteriota bacterium]MDQ7086725.1 hypothetical protein [Acidobacteriota bacterium]
MSISTHPPRPTTSTAWPCPTSASITPAVGGGAGSRERSGQALNNRQAHQQAADHPLRSLSRAGPSSSRQAGAHQGETPAASAPDPGAAAASRHTPSIQSAPAWAMPRASSASAPAGASTAIHPPISAGSNPGAATAVAGIPQGDSLPVRVTRRGHVARKGAAATSRRR